MDRALVKKINNDVRLALELVSQKYGLTLKLKNGSFTSEMYRPSFEFYQLSNGTTSIEENEWNKWHATLGLKKEWLGKSLSSGKKIIGLDMRKRKYPVILVSKNGTRYKTTASSVISNLGVI